METQLKMEIVFKQPKDKPPCICILFENNYQAGRYQQTIINQFRKYPFVIKFEEIGGRLKIFLKVRDYNFDYKYENIEYSSEKLYKFLYNTKDSQAYSFCHVFLKDGNHELAKTSVNVLPWVLKVSSVELVREY